MKKWTIVLGAAALICGAMLLPGRAQNVGRSIVRETFVEPPDFVRVGSYVINRAHIAYVARHGDGATVYLTGNVPPIMLPDQADALIAQLVGPEEGGEVQPNEAEPALKPSEKPGEPEPPGPFPAAPTADPQPPREMPTPK